jgi:hypothetical protein
MRITPAQRRFLRRLATVGESLVPGGYPEAGRDASNWYRTVAILERLGLVTGDRGYEDRYVRVRRGAVIQERRVLVPRLHGSPRRVYLTLPAPAFIYEE